MPIDAKERQRRRALVKAHYAAENDHDLDRIMNTFADDGVMHYNSYKPSGGRKNLCENGRI